MDLPLIMYHGIFYRLTREKKELQKVFPFYWWINGPISEPLEELLALLEVLGLHYNTTPNIYQVNLEKILKIMEMEYE